MKKTSAFSRKTTKVATASALGVALLLGGGTYALWTSNVTANTQATITSGDLKVTSAAAQKWSDVTDTANPAVISDLAAYRLAPGSTLQLKQDLNVVVVGDNISGILNVTVPNTTTGAALQQSVFNIKVADKTGKELTNFTGTPTDGTLKASLSNLPQTVPAGETYTVTITVALPTAADNATKNQTINLSDMQVTLDQGAKYVAPVVTP